MSEFIGKQIKRTIFSTHRLKIESVWKLPAPQYSTYNTSSLNDVSIDTGLNEPYLILTLITKDGDWRDKSFMITRRGYYDFMRYMYEVVSWFDDTDGYKDLFMRNEDDLLVFNSDYNNLKVDIKERTSNKTMRILPNICEEKNIRHEGVHIFINNIVNLSPIKSEDLFEMVMCLKDFSFQTEMSVVSNIYLLATLSNKITPIKSFDNNGDNYIKKGNNYIKSGNSNAFNI